jgi:hypothetical protein
MSLVGAPSIRFLESKLLLLPVVIKGADRRIVVWPVKRHTADDLDTRAQSNWIGRKPAGRMHRGKDIFLAANKSNIERVSWNAIGSARHHRQGSQAGLMLVMGPQQGKEDVSQQDIADCYARQNEQPSSFHRTSFIQIALCRALWPLKGYASQTTVVYAETEGTYLKLD